MTKRRKNTFRLSIIKYLLLAAIIASFLIFLHLITPPPIYKNLQGTYSLILNECRIERNCSFMPCGCEITVNGWNLQLPPFNTGGYEGYEGILQMNEDGKAKWDVINKEKDSIEIKAPKHILQGKYHIRLKVIRDSVNKAHIFMILSNDSTLLKCKKYTNN